jgi:hypothetical protein
VCLVTEGCTVYIREESSFLGVRHQGTLLPAMIGDLLCFTLLLLSRIVTLAVNVSQKGLQSFRIDQVSFLVPLKCDR